MTSFDLYQAFLGDSQRQLVAPPAIPYDVAGNTGNDQREYGLFKKIFAERSGGSGPWGLVSRKFEHKSLVPLERFHAFASERFAAGADCVFINPMVGNAAMHTTVWEQWGVANRSISHLCEYLSQYRNVSYDRPMGEDSFAFCNYFAATNRFWEAYFDFVDTCIDQLEREKAAQSPLGVFYGGSGRYQRDLTVTTKPFIIERLFSSFLISSHGFKVAAYPHSDEIYAGKFGARIGEILRHLSGLKRRGLDGDAEAWSEWQRLRKKVAKDHQFAIWDMDDPPELPLEPA